LAILQEAISEGDDTIRLLFQLMIQPLLEKEITSYLEAETYERTDERKGYRNGYQPRTFITCVDRR